MSNVVYDLTARLYRRTEAGPLHHPAGVLLPFDGPSDADLIIPEIRGDIRSGAYSADMLRLLPEAIQPGDRVLVIGAGLGVVSTVVARHPGVKRVIAVEANTRLIPYLNRVLALNRVREVETVNAILADGRRGRAPFFTGRDLRNSSLIPHGKSWQQVIMVPFMDLSLILAEERISLVICDIPAHSARVVAQSRLDEVQRILAAYDHEEAAGWEAGELRCLLNARGYLSGPGDCGQGACGPKAQIFRKPPQPD